MKLLWVIWLPWWAESVSAGYFQTALAVELLCAMALAGLGWRRLARWRRPYRSGVAVALPLSGMAILNVAVNVVGFLWLLRRTAEANAGQSAPFW